MVIKGSFEDYFYVIIGIIWIAVSIYKGAQKRKQTSPKPSEAGEEESPSILDTIFDEFVEKDEVVYQSPEYSEIEAETDQFKPTEVKNTEQAPVFSYDDAYEESNINEYDDVYRYEPLTTHSTDELDELPKRRRKRRFDIRKAVIYSEILRPPYL